MGMIHHVLLESIGTKNEKGKTKENRKMGVANNIPRGE